MKNEKMNKALGMLDDDVIADALEGKRAGGIVVSRRKFMTALIAATLAIAILAGSVAVAFSIRGGKGPVSLLPPEGSTVIRNVTSSVQLTPGTVYSSGNYYSVESQFASVESEQYALVNQVELDGELYESMVASNDPNRTWAVEVSVSPNFYMTEDYIEREIAYWASQYEAADLGALVGIYEQIKTDFDINALYEANKDKYDLDELYKYFASGELEADILNADIEALKKKAEQLWDECIDIQSGHWENLVPGVRKILDDFGIEYIEEDHSFVIFVTEGELLALEGFTGVKFSKAGMYAGYSVSVGKYATMTEWNGKLISKDLASAIAANDGKDVLYAVTAEPAVFGEMLDRSNYEAKYLALFADAAKRPSWRALLEIASADGSKLQNAIDTCGEEVVLKYLKDGAFDAAAFDNDTAAINAELEVMRTNLYREATEVYAEFASLVRYIEITESGNVVFYVTAKELANLKTSGEYCFKLAA